MSEPSAATTRLRSRYFGRAAAARGSLLAQAATSIRQRPAASLGAAQRLIKPLSEPVESRAKTCCPPGGKKRKEKKSSSACRSLFFTGCVCVGGEGGMLPDSGAAVSASTTVGFGLGFSWAPVLRLFVLLLELTGPLESL